MIPFITGTDTAFSIIAGAEESCCAASIATAQFLCLIEDERPLSATRAFVTAAVCFARADEEEELVE